jgi:murein tripeptide amidase MpaA
MNFNHYFSNDEIETILKAWSLEFPQLFALETIGKSHEGRPIWLATLTNHASGGALEKPAVWLDANIHATELAGTTAVLYFLNQALTRYGQDERITRLLDSTAFYVVARINPDGAAQALADPPKFLRSGVRPYPWEEKEEGIHTQDIDGDGRVLQMRIPDSSGEWKISEQDTRLMVKRAPDEHGGQYYRLLPEGLAEEYDGYVVKVARPLQGLDFNRNFPFDWHPEDQQTGSGSYPASEPEIQAVVDFIAKHPNINFALTFHTYSRVLLRPFSTRSDDAIDFADLRVFQEAGAIGTRLTGYRNVSTFNDFRHHAADFTYGAFDDWIYDQLGAFVWTVELWDLPTEAGIADRKLIEWFRNHPPEDDLKILQWADQHAGPNGYVEWYSYQHSQLGNIELGGWNSLYTWRNPPPQLMEKEASLHTPFILSLADMLPQLSIHHLNVKPLSENTWLVELGVENSGYLPTYTSQQAKKRGIARPVFAELILPASARLVTGKSRQEMGHLEGRSNKDTLTSVHGSSPTDNRARAIWVMEAPTGTSMEIKVRTERAGAIRKTITLSRDNT